MCQVSHAPPSPSLSSDAFPDFYVNGATLPHVNYDIGPSWSGLIPISGAANETRKVLSSGNISRRLRLYLTRFSVVLLVLSSRSRRKSG